MIISTAIDFNINCVFNIIRMKLLSSTSYLVKKYIPSALGFQQQGLKNCDIEKSLLPSLGCNFEIIGLKLF